MPEPAHVTFALETYARRALNYLDRMVDADRLPYFNVFWETPPEAAHDWPDFGDVMTRALQGAVMARRMTGQACVNEAVWLRKALGYIDPATGLITRPQTSFSEGRADQGDYGLTLYALATVYDDAPDPKLAAVIRRMVDGFPDAWPRGEFVIKGLMAAARSLDYAPAADLAGQCVRSVMEAGTLLQDDNTYPFNGHMHGLTHGLLGAADYALYTGDPVLFSRVDAGYRHLLAQDPGFGFLAEVVDRQGDVIACETCTLMDYVALGATLANNGHPKYWASIERLVRNHLAESQAADTAWLGASPDAPDTEQFTRSDIAERVAGAYAGWSSPTQFLACREELHWGGPELRGKVRAFQNCCGGSGTHAYYVAWKNASRFDAGTLWVNMHIDKLLPQAEIRCMQPYRGLLAVALKQDASVRVRVPDFAARHAVRVWVNGAPAVAAFGGTYLRLDGCLAGDRIEVRYPVPRHTDTVSIGNRTPDGARDYWRQYRYRVTWLGDTVVRMEPLGRMPRRGYSDFEKRAVDVFYGEDGPCRLYRRAHMLEDVEPEPVALWEDTSPVDHWRLR